MKVEKEAKDKLEFVKQTKTETQKVLSHKIIPYENHSLFECNLKDGTIELAQFKPPNTTIHWLEALEKYHKKVIKKVNIFNASTVTKSEVIKRENCIYISAMNKENVIKILKRNYNVIF